MIWEVSSRVWVLVICEFEELERRRIRSIRFDKGLVVEGSKREEKWGCKFGGFGEDVCWLCV